MSDEPRWVGEGRAGQEKGWGWGSYSGSCWQVRPLPRGWESPGLGAGLLWLIVGMVQGRQTPVFEVCIGKPNYIPSQARLPGLCSLTEESLLHIIMKPPHPQPSTGVLDPHLSLPGLPFLIVAPRPP